MREDQLHRLRDLEERLVDTFLDEADPDEWPGAGLKPADMEAKDRGDRYWAKKNAAATGILAQRVVSMIAESGLSADDPEQERQLDQQIASAEREAAKLVQRLAGKGKAEFDRRVHGKS